jgi:hypothetical protein
MCADATISLACLQKNVRRIPASTNICELGIPVLESSRTMFAASLQGHTFV